MNRQTLLSRISINPQICFGKPNFDPTQYSGIAVLRLPNQAAHQDLLDAIATLIGALNTEDIQGKLWIVQRGQIRIYQPEN